MVNLLTKLPATIDATVIDELVYTSALSEDQNLRLTCQNAIRRLAKGLGIYSASHFHLYEAFAQGKIQGFTVPALNIRTLTYDFCRRVFRLSIKHNIGIIILELAASEQQYTNQPPSEFSASILAAAIKEGYKGPVFIQGDHYQVKSTTFKKNKEEEIQRLKNLISDSIQAHIYNIDIDGSTIVDLDKQDVTQQQKNNCEITALLTEYIRSIEPPQVSVSIGGEIGHIGGKNSTVADYIAFIEGYTALIHDKNVKGLSKIAVQTGTSHGGTPLPDGSIKEVSIDFSILRNISALSREKYHIGGSVQHGASTLPEEMLSEFPKNNTLEIHLSTGFQNIIFDTIPNELRNRIYDWIRTHLRDEMSEDMNDMQFIYKTRKKALGTFKKDMWNIPDDEKNHILDALENKMEIIFSKLQINNTKDAVTPYY